MKIIFALFILSFPTAFSMNESIEKGINFCEDGKIDSALYYLNIIGDEVTIETTIEDIFQKNYHTAICYDKLEANKSAEYYYLKAIGIMDSSEVSDNSIYLRMSNFYERIMNYKGSNDYLRKYYDSEFGKLNTENTIANEKLLALDTLEKKVKKMEKAEIKLHSDIRLLIVLIALFGSSFFISLIVIFKQKKAQLKS